MPIDVSVSLVIAAVVASAMAAAASLDQIRLSTPEVTQLGTGLFPLIPFAMPR